MDKLVSEIIDKCLGHGGKRLTRVGVQLQIIDGSQSVLDMDVKDLGMAAGRELGLQKVHDALALLALSSVSVDVRD